MLYYKQKVWLVVLVLFGACVSEPQQQKEAIKNQKTNIHVPKFNTDSAYQYIQKQVDFGPRALSSKGWENCAIWLEKKLQQYTPNVLVQEAPTTTYDGKNHTLKNIIASFSPEKNNRIALFAHWDTRPIADFDNRPVSQTNFARPSRAPSSQLQGVCLPLTSLSILPELGGLQLYKL